MQMALERPAGHLHGKSTPGIRSSAVVLRATGAERNHATPGPLAHVEVPGAADLPVVRDNAVVVVVEQVAAAHLPGHDRTVGVAPQDVAGAVAIEVAGTFDLPAG